MIRNDMMNKMLVILGVTIIFYLATFQLEVLILFPALLLISGLVMQMFLLKGVGELDALTEPETLRSVMFYTLLGLAGLAVTALLIPAVRKVPAAIAAEELTAMQLLGFSVLMAIAEEQFFRGFVANFLLQKGLILGLVGSSAIFTVYHFAVYGGSAEALIYVFAGGLILAWVGVGSRRLSVPTCVHILNNVIAAGVG